MYCHIVSPFLALVTALLKTKNQMTESKIRKRFVQELEHNTHILLKRWHILKES